MPALPNIPSARDQGPLPRALRVLVVEDNAVIAMLLAATLTDMGHEVCATEATEEGAVAAAARDRPTLLIVDAHLSEGGGVSAVDRILRTGFVPHIFVSGDELRPEMLDARAVRLIKPYDERDLLSAIRRALAAPDAPEPTLST